MSKDDRNISNIKVNEDCYKVLKIIGIEKDLSLQQVVKDVLEKYASKRGRKEIAGNDEV